MARYVVTGGAGFVGAHLTRALIEHGHEVRVLDDLSAGRADRLAGLSARLTVGDVCDPAVVTPLVEGADGCFHLAAVSSVDQTVERWLDSHRVNAGGAVAILEASRRVGGVPVVYASSAAVYGDTDRPLIDEGAPTQPISPYGADKLSNELHALMASRQFGIPTVGLRFFNIYGPHQDATSSYAGVISLFIAKALKGAPFLIHGDGGQERDFVYVDDAVSALIVAMSKAQPGGDVFNICTGAAVRILDIASIISHLVGRSPEFAWGPQRTGDIRRSVGDGSLAVEKLGFRADTRVASGLERLFASYSAAA